MVMGPDSATLTNPSVDHIIENNRFSPRSWPPPPVRLNAWVPGYCSSMTESTSCIGVGEGSANSSMASRVAVRVHVWPRRKENWSCTLENESRNGWATTPANGLSRAWPLVLDSISRPVAMTLHPCNLDQRGRIDASRRAWTKGIGLICMLNRDKQKCEIDSSRAQLFPRIARTNSSAAACGLLWRVRAEQTEVSMTVPVITGLSLCRGLGRLRRVVRLAGFMRSERSVAKVYSKRHMYE